MPHRNGLQHIAKHQATMPTLAISHLTRRMTAMPAINTAHAHDFEWANSQFVTSSKRQIATRQRTIGHAYESDELGTHVLSLRHINIGSADPEATSHATSAHPPKLLGWLKHVRMRFLQSDALLTKIAGLFAERGTSTRSPCDSICPHH